MPGGETQLLSALTVVAAAERDAASGSVRAGAPPREPINGSGFSSATNTGVRIGSHESSAAMGRISQLSDCHSFLSWSFGDRRLAGNFNLRPELGGVGGRKREAHGIRSFDTASATVAIAGNAGVNLLAPDIAGGLRGIGGWIGAESWLVSHVVARLFLFWQHLNESRGETLPR